MSGGEIYWDCIGSNQYRITMVIYRDCFGINVDPSYNLVLTSPCGNRNLTVTTPGGLEISQLCDIELPNSTCNGGNLPGIQQYIYTGTITLPPCDSWTVSYTNIYRNAAVANLINPGQQRTYIRAVFNTATSPCNDSPQFTNTAIPYVCLGYPFTYSFGAFDPESDSLSFEFIPAMGIAGAPLGYVNPYTGAQPIPGITLNPATGEVNFTLNNIGNWVVVVKVNHWVNGVIVGHIMRDMQFVAYPCDNIPPDPATGVVEDMTGQATQTGPRAVEVCRSGDFCFDMVISDPNTTNVLEAFSNVQMNLPGSSFSYTGTNPITATVCWSASAGSTGFYPFIVNVNDGACPIPAFQTYIYAVRVLPGLTATLEVLDENCQGSGDGSINTTVTAGTGPYSYNWSNGSSEASISSGPGEYAVVIEDSNGCISAPLSASIGTEGLPNLADAGGDLNGCVGVPIGLSGTVQNATGGIWSGGQGTFTGSGLTVQYTPSQADLLEGSATLTLTTMGNTSCPPASDQMTITLANSFANATTSAIDATCYNTANGSASFSPATPGFTYLWDDPAAQTTATATGLGAGTYQVTATDALGCSIALSATVGPQDPITISNITTTDESCLGNGSVSVAVIGGTAPYTYAWSTGSTAPSITAGSGTYTVSVSDANGCSPANGQAIIAAQGQPNAANAGADLVGCQNSLPVVLNGSVTNATGGSWSGGSGTITGTGLAAQYTPSLAEVLAGGTSLVLSTTGNTTCATATDTVFITLSNSFLQASISSVDATCSDAFNGSATFAPSLPGMSFLWNDPAAQTTATATGLGAGTYQVTATDALGCSITLSATLGPQDPITISNITATDEACLGDGSGTATVVPNGGTPPYAITWSNGATTASITGTSGTYSVSVTDANGCTPATAQVTINAQGQPNAANAGADLVGCQNSLPVVLNGSVTNATGGSWSGGSGTITGTGLAAQYTPSLAEVLAGGTSLVLSTTGNTTCATATDTVFITLSNSFLQASISSVDATCSDAFNGSATFAPSLPGMSFLWNDPAAQTTATALNLGAGTYLVTVTDALGCGTTMTAAIGPAGAIGIASITATDEACLGDGSGTATVVPNGGTPPYAITWSNGATTASITGTSGTYSVSVTDANGCTPATAQVTINAQGIPNVANAGPDQVGCSNSLPLSLNGSVTNATGGIWSGGNGSFLGAGLSPQYMPSSAEVLAGQVQLVLNTTGNTSCPADTDTITIALSNSFLLAAITSSGVSCNGLANGTASFSPDLPGLDYLWNDPAAQGTATATGLPAGIWSVTVTDALGCDTTMSVVIQQPATLAIAQASSVPVTCNGGQNGSASVSISGGTPGFTISWSNGQSGPAINGLGAGNYSATVTDAQGCSAQTNIAIAQPAPILLTAQAPDTVCVNAAVDLSATASGGTAPLIINWAGLGQGTTLQTSFATSQVVSVTVTDAAGCSGPTLLLPVHVLDLQSATLTTYGDTTVCPGGSAIVGASVSGYAGAYTMIWPQLGAFGNGPFTVPVVVDIDLAVTVSDACANNLSGIVALRLDEPPTVSLPPLIAEGCAPLTVQMPDLGLGSGMQYVWDLGNGNSSAAPAPLVTYDAGTYAVSVTVSTALGCTVGSSNSGQVIAHEPPVAAFAASPWSTDAANATIAFTDQSTGSVTTYEWQFGDGGTGNTPNVSYTFSDVGTFYVELWVEDIHGCVDSVSHPVTITPVYDITLPTAFTPNPNGGSGGAWDPNDQSNDVFYPFARFVEDFRMRIFNRWGELIFESDDIRIGWDGYYRGQLSPQDVYVVQAWFRFVDGKEVQKLSDLTLFR